jgi:hypothetical protein
MKAELVKRQDRWDLYGEDGSKIASSAPNPIGKLSIKNCEAIENGYDLDELAKERTKKQLIRLLGGEDREEVLDDIKKRKFYFIEGAKAILEILGDKKFSEKQLKHNMLQLFYLEKNEDEAEAVFKERQLAFIENSIQSLQQTEWDVIVETVGLSYLRDKDDCLILKRI